MKILLISVVIVAGGVLWWVSQGPAPEAPAIIAAEEQLAVQAELAALPEPADAVIPVATTSAPIVEPSTDGVVATEAVSLPDPGPAPATQAERDALLAQLWELQSEVDRLTEQEPVPYHDFVDPSGFVNSEPFTLSELIGEKVILLKFTTYSCINCQRTYPYVVDWHNTYADQGLAVVAVHTPEFSFERDINNVQAAMDDEGITFPVVLDNDYRTWRAYGNRFWPRMYLIDKNGNVVYDHIGEGAYALTEAKIQTLLADLNQDQ